MGLGIKNDIACILLGKYPFTCFLGVLKEIPNCKNISLVLNIYTKINTMKTLNSNFSDIVLWKT